ncbi:MAG: carbohydrate kinase [Anaerolineaceae bacterium]|nr:carbohydrate kinase [Anaerolineaceae bacterium]
MKLLSFGEILWDIIGKQQHLGGAPFNLAVHAARCGMDAGIVSALGTDALGTQALQATTEHHVDPRFIQVLQDYPTGRVDVTVSAQGQPDYVIHEHVAFDHIAMDEPTIEAIVAQAYDVFCFGTLVQRCEASRSSLVHLLERLRSTPCRIFCDVNLRQHYYHPSVLEFCLDACHILKLNEDEVAVLGQMFFHKTFSALEEVCSALAHAKDIDIILVTLGPRGAGLFAQGTFYRVPGLSVQVADTVGAGDAFSAKFLSHYLNSGDLMGAIERANALGAYVASRPGALPQYDHDTEAFAKRASHTITSLDQGRKKTSEKGTYHDETT